MLSTHASAVTTSERYDGVAKAIHWTVALLVLVQFGTKFVPIGALGYFTENRLNQWHVAIGPTILALMVVRLLWRMTHPAPPPPADLSTPLRIVSRVTHWLFYGTLLIIPVLGWIAASGYGVTAYVLGVIPLPALIGNNEALAGRVGGVHGLLAWVLLAIIALHIAGALFHALIKRDDVMARMLPG